MSSTSISLDYCPFPLSSDEEAFGLSTSTIATGAGTVSVRHGRRSASDTATVLLHGAAGSWTTWTPLISAADSLDGSALTDLVIPDLPGWGRTPLPSEQDSLTIEVMAGAVAAIASSLGYRRWIVVGHSLGGFIALQLAATETAATVRVGLVSATTFSVIDSVRHPVTQFTLLPWYTALLQVMRVLSLLGPAGRALVRFVDQVRLLRPLVAPLFSQPARIDGTVIAALATEARPRAFSLASARAGRYDAERQWSRIVCPVRATRGDTDVFVAGTDQGRLGRVIHDFASEIIPGTGHFGHVEKPYDTVEALLGRG